MTIGTVTSKGQITIPAEVRELLGLVPGSRVDFVDRGDGIVELRVVNRSVRAVKGIVRTLSRPVTLSEMDEAIASGAGNGAAAR